jgi:CHASE2 domain-containing sensor protein
MARSAVLTGRTFADLVRNIFVVLLMSAMGFLVGWRINTNAIALLAGLALVVAFAYSLSWVFAIVGLYARDGETAQAASFPILAPLVFGAVGVRQCRHDAGAAQSVRGAPTGHHRRRRRARSHPRRRATTSDLVAAIADRRASSRSVP